MSAGQDMHFVNGRPIQPPFPDDTELATFAMGCFWGVEKLFWSLTGVYSTAVGYSGGQTKNPSYRDVCTSDTGHAEVVRVVFFPRQITFSELLRIFWEGHDPTQGMRQGNDTGSQYRSAVFYHSPEQRDAAISTRDAYQDSLDAAGFGKITTEISPAGELYHAEDYHQQYLAKNPGAYCGLGGTGITCPLGAA